MRAIGSIRLLPACLLAAIAPASAEEPPRDSGQVEQVEVHLMLLETLALDRRGRTVTDLTREDFRITVEGRPTQIDTFDVLCPGGPEDDPLPARPDRVREAPAPGSGRLLALVIDYYHLDHPHRFEVLERLLTTVLPEKAADDRWMIVALANGLRLEQGFTEDPEPLRKTLERMQSDVTLYAGSFLPLTERSFFEDLATLMDVLGEYDGSKAAVLYTMAMLRSDVVDLWFGLVSNRAALARTAIYPMWAGGLEAWEPTGGSPALARLANESGGRFTRNTNDLSLAYLRARRDLGCRYLLGIYVERAEAGESLTVHVRPTRSGIEIRAPEQIRLQSPDDRRKARLEAAFVDPQRHDDGSLQLGTLPLRPSSPDSWEVLALVRLAAGASATMSPPRFRDGAQLEARLDRGATTLRKFENPIPDAATASSTYWTLVTLRARDDYSLSAALSEDDGTGLRTTRQAFAVPEIPADGIFVPAPLLTRLGRASNPLFRSGRGQRKPRTQRQLEDWGAFEPLLTPTVSSTEILRVLWQVCSSETTPTTRQATVVQRVAGPKGEQIAATEPRVMRWKRRGEVRCTQVTEELDAGRLPPGQLQLELHVLSPDGAPLAQRSVTLQVR